MNHTLASASRTHRPAVRKQSRPVQRAALPPRQRSPRRDRQPLARYTDRDGRPREVIVRRGLAGSVLVVDRDAVSLGDCLLVAHLAADEPPENAAVVCRAYLDDVRARRCRFRGLTEQDARSTPLPEEPELPAGQDPDASEGEATDALGVSYRLELVPAGMSIPALRWCRRPLDQASAEPDPISLRETIARTESYEPMCSLTRRALARHRDDREVSTSVLAAELERVHSSPIVLNRRLREAVLARIEAEGLSMSEIAIRCGRVKRDSRGNESGETSWLARRLGLLADSGQDSPTPWIHSDVLALIARRGLSIDPREVELQ